VFTSVIVFIGALLYFVAVRGPREYVVPADAPETAPLPATESDVSQVDVSTEEETARKAPRSYRVVGEEQFREYERTGVLERVPETPEPEPPADKDDGEKAGSSARSTDEH
jgi:hypothetical protein